MLIDTNVAIFLQDRQSDIWRRVAITGERPSISLISLVELEGGVAAIPEKAAGRREALSRLLSSLTVLPVDEQVVTAYAGILATTGFSRSRILDRLIAATAIVHDPTVVTTNGPDFAPIPGLKLEVWPRPAQ